MSPQASTPSARPARREELIEPSKIQKVLREEHFGNDQADSDEQRFVESVAHWLQNWLDNSGEDCSNMQPCVFVFAGDQGTDNIIDDVELAPSFRQTHDQSVTGQVHVCSLELKQVRRRHVGFVDAPAALSWISGGPAAECVAIVFIPKLRAALVRRSGVSFDDCERLEFGGRSGGAFDFSQVDALLNQFHEKWTRPHQGYCRVWAKATSRTLKPQPESQIQGSLKAFFDFTVRPRGVLVDEEFFTRLGRGDVRLVRWHKGNSKNPGGTIETCMMELKVLDQKRGPKRNREWALKGIKQVLDYRQTEGEPGPSYLCCFDGRKTDADIPEVVAEATKQGVASRRYFMETPGCP